MGLWTLLKIASMGRPVKRHIVVFYCVDTLFICSYSFQAEDALSIRLAEEAQPARKVHPVGVPDAGQQTKQEESTCPIYSHI